MHKSFTKPVRRANVSILDGELTRTNSPVTWLGTEASASFTILTEKDRRYFGIPTLKGRPQSRHNARGRGNCTEELIGQISRDAGTFAAGKAGSTRRGSIKTMLHYRANALHTRGLLNYRKEKQIPLWDNEKNVYTLLSAKKKEFFRHPSRSSWNHRERGECLHDKAAEKSAPRVRRGGMFFIGAFYLRGRCCRDSTGDDLG